MKVWKFSGTQAHLTTFFNQSIYSTHIHSFQRWIFIRNTGTPLAVSNTDWVPANWNIILARMYWDTLLHLINLISTSTENISHISHKTFRGLDPSSWRDLELPSLPPTVTLIQASPLDGIKITPITISPYLTSYSIFEFHIFSNLHQIEKSCFMWSGRVSQHALASDSITWGHEEDMEDRWSQNTTGGETCYCMLMASTSQESIGPQGRLTISTVLTWCRCNDTLLTIKQGVIYGCLRKCDTQTCSVQDIISAK